ncbi:MAG TPA: RluA family pseudouridine synthase [Gemmata sp.]|jgi:23S rRNA pseudouridine1911/1915/1917 synthase|nr:RluA family pseudouridine synthase [Gemmata sp.]
MSSNSNDLKLPSPDSETSLLSWLIDVLEPMNRTRVKQLLRSGRVAVNNVATTRHDHPLHPDDHITVLREVPSSIRNRNSKRNEIALLFLDDAVVAIDKPPGLLTVATESEKLDTAFARLNAHLHTHKAGRPFVVHRLDRETSGLLLFARSAEIRDHFQAHWGLVKKTYLAVVEGQPKSPEGTIENFLLEGRNLRVRMCNKETANARRAVSRYRLIANRGNYSLVEVELETGRKHQIRVHMSGLGCPIIGDAAYGAATNPVGRLGLHAWRLAFDHPLTGKRIELESPFPEKLGRVVGLPGSR